MPDNREVRLHGGGAIHPPPPPTPREKISVMDGKEFNLWCRRLGIKGEAREFIGGIREGEPVRLVRGYGGSVVGIFPSRKMGRTIQFESHRCELSFIQQMERNPEVLEFWDQPTKFTITYENKAGKKVTAPYIPDFLVIYKDHVELIECKTEEDLIKLAEEQPNRYRLGDDGTWHSPPAEEYVKRFGGKLRYAIHPSSNINRVYVRNIEFLDDYFRQDALLLDAGARQFILSAVRGHPGISLAELLDRVVDEKTVRVESDDVYILMIRGDVYVDLKVAPLIERHLVRVFECAEQAEIYTPAGSPPLAPRAQYADVSEGTRLVWDGRVWEVSNVGAEKVWLVGELSDAAIPRDTFERYVNQNIVEVLGSPTETNPYQEGLEILGHAEPGVLKEAERRLELIKPYVEGALQLKAADKERSLRRYVAAFREAQAYYGVGLVGLLPNWYADGKCVKRLPPQVYEIMDDRIENDFETLTQKGMWIVYGSVLNDCEAAGIPEDEQPSYVTFCKRVNSRPLDEQTRKRKGKRAAYQHETHIFWIDKDTPPHGDRPFHVAHADFTELNIELVCPITGGNLGRPYVGFLIDAHTRLLLAIYITFDPPSYRSTMMLLRECAARHKRLPQVLVVDRGKEFDNVYLRRLAGAFEMTVKFRPAAKPRHGSVEERLFGTAQDEFVHNLVGNTQIMAEIRKVIKSANPKNLAVWSLGPFTEWFTAWGYEIYNKRPHWNLKLTPLKAFARSLELTGKRRGRIAYDETFRILTMPTTRKRTAKNVTDKGVKINSIYYWSDVLRERRIMGRQLHVRYDPFDISVAYVFVRGQWVKCKSEQVATFERCTERQLKIASEELRERNRKFLRARPLTAKMLADFISRAETVQSGLAEKRLLRQRAHDRESLPIIRALDSGVPFQSHQPQTPDSASEHAAVGSPRQAPDASPFARVDFNSIDRLKELK
ncbi:MAG TPA: Mu transposase C-terminal domain-containing protein [Pyrinomonadaceae bacterium]|jgi:transposase InsO family protein